MKRIEAEEVILKDGAGRHRAILAMERGGPRLTMLDTAGRRRAVLAASEHAAGIFFYDSDGQKRVWVGFDERGGESIALWSKDGELIFGKA